MQELLQGSFASQLPAVMTSKESFNLKQLKVTPPQPPPKKKEGNFMCVYNEYYDYVYDIYLYIYIYLLMKAIKKSPNNQGLAKLRHRTLYYDWCTKFAK